MSEQQGEEARPEWLPEKFKDTKQMAEAYKELEQKMSSGGTPEPAAEEPTADAPEAAPTEAEPTPVPEDMDLKIDVSAQQAADWVDEFSKEFNEKGELSEESFASLEKRGLPRRFVESYIEGQKALVQGRVQSVVSAVGGQEAYGELVQWAAQNLSEQEVASFNQMVTGNSLDQARFAVMGLKARRDGVMGTGSKLKQGTGAASGAPEGLEPFETLGQLIQAQSDPRYKTSPKYRESVMARLERSNF